MFQASLLSILSFLPWFTITFRLGSLLGFEAPPMRNQMPESKPEVTVVIINEKARDEGGILGADAQSEKVTPVPSSPNLKKEPQLMVSEELLSEVKVSWFPTVKPAETKEIEAVHPISTPQAPNLEPQSILTTAVNNYRRGKGVGAFHYLSELCWAAETRVQEITTHFSHDGYEKLVAPLGFTSVAENIFYSSSYTVDENIEAWHSSSGHRENMLGSYTYGCGVERGGYAVFLFMNR